jgi:hypothetical protein
MDLTAASVIGLLLALAAALLLARDVRRAWRDPWRRPITLLAAALIALLLIGTLMERDHPHPGWLFLPAGVLLWEVLRGWRRAPRCHLWEGGIAALTASLVLAAIGLHAAGFAGLLLAAAGVAAVMGLFLLWQSRRREPRPWRAGDRFHYERRQSDRNTLAS